ncbi:hypothetical protein K435DRAFT_841129 [Dendrothele bispora CBS 962.96]|uniref:CHAT domain-containing protein n=1 Tax=Dendrothele bispora (strain CBS 962.96) TaxID=1314807 RepID=A0A4S8LP73_DENBC|nr:hypothetical protein K435DRAFT_841129 [Dendrothele bispora CBS 962.96]
MNLCEDEKKDAQDEYRWRNAMGQVDVLSLVVPATSSPCLSPEPRESTLLAQLDNNVQIKSLERLEVDWSSNLDCKDTPQSIDQALEMADKSISLLKQVEDNEELELIENVIANIQAAMELIPGDNPRKPMCLTNLGNALKSRFDRLGNHKDLERAITLQHSVVNLISDSHPHKPTFLNNLASSLATRFHHHGTLEDLEYAIALMSRAVDLIPDGHSDKPIYLKNLGDAFETHFERSGELETLQKAIALEYRSVSLIPDGHLEKPSCLSTLGNALLRRFEHVDNLEDITNAISLISPPIIIPRNLVVSPTSVTLSRHDLTDLRRAVDLSPKGHPDEAKYLHNLGNVILTRFDRLGGLDDLEDAIDLMRRAVELTPDGQLTKPGRLTAFGDALETRFVRLGEVNDINSAILFKRRAVELIPDGHHHKPGYLSSLGSAFQARFNQGKDTKDLDNAITAHHEAADAISDDHPRKPAYLNNLGSSFARRFEHLHELDDLHTSITLAQRAISLTPPSHPDEAGRLSNLAHFLSMRYRRTRELDDLTNAIGLWRRALDLTPDGHPSRGHLYIALGQAIWVQYDRSYNISHRSAAFECFLSAANSESAPPSLRLWAAKRSASFCWQNIGTSTRDKLLPIYEQTLALIPQVVWLGHNINRRYKELSEIGDIANAAAAAAIAAGKYSLAVEWLEEGRTIIWGQLLQLRNPMTILNERHPDLAKELQDVSRALEDPSSNFRDGSISHEDHHYRPNTLDEVSHRTRLAGRYKSLLAIIREKEGFERFMLRKPFAELAPACRSGPVIVLNEHGSRCDALVLCSPSRIIHVPLIDLTELLAETMRAEMAESLTMAGIRSRWSKPLSRHGASDSNGIMARVLGQLWSRVVHPVLRAIEGERFECEVGDLPHVTWCPNGRLGFLPLHAAGDYSTEHGNKTYDFVVSSYTPSLSALAPESSFRSISPLSLESILVVSQPAPPDFAPDLPSLPGVRKETEAIKTQFSMDHMIHLDSEKATIQAVLDTMDERPSQVIHLACHGVQDPDDPWKSAFVLHDGKLELSRLMSKSTEIGALAVLSACQTAKGDVQLSEEAVHLAAGMLAVGYRAVVGSMWSIGDSDAPLVSRELYSYLKKDIEERGEFRAAYALHQAVKKLRESLKGSSEGKNLVRWVPFVHFGL